MDKCNSYTQPGAQGANDWFRMELIDSTSQRFYVAGYAYTVITTYTVGTWAQAVVTWNNRIFTAFINGTSVGSVNYDPNLTPTTSYLWAGYGRW